MAESKTFVLTGTSSGIGKAAAKLLVSNGNAVIGLDIKEPDFELKEFHHCDLSKVESIDQTLAKLTGRYASVLNIAGVPVAFGKELTMKVNILGLRHFTEGIWQRIEDGGTVVNVSSIAGNNWRNRRAELTELLSTRSFDEGLTWWESHQGSFNVDEYTLSKEAVVLYSMMLARRGIDRKINVVSIGPGPVDTPLLPSFTQDVGAANMNRLIDVVGRAAQPNEIAEAIVVFAERKLSWVNGVHIPVDGGLSAALSTRSKPAAGR
jgi:NAD(P)-dependent dehydrogenase (short-subunit alcohol dehydrogenase family)